MSESCFATESGFRILNVTRMFWASFALWHCATICTRAAAPPVPVAPAAPPPLPARPPPLPALPLVPAAPVVPAPPAGVAAAGRRRPRAARLVVAKAIKRVRSLAPDGRDQRGNREEDQTSSKRTRESSKREHDYK